MTIVFAGEPGAFAEDAVLAAFGDVPRRGVGGFRQVFETVQRGEAAGGVVPIENLVGGTVRENYDLLLEHSLEVVGEVIVPVGLCLAARPGESIESIERVYSHIQALGQAELFLRGRPWTLLTTYNTAGAGKMIAESGEAGAAAVLSPRAAALFGLEILVQEIADVADNRTRFLAMARPHDDGSLLPAWRAATGEGSRTVLAFGVRNAPGTLLEALRTFASRGINLSKLESRPARSGPWEYVFWADLDAGQREPACAEAIEDLRGHAAMVRVLGSYPRPADG